MSNHPNLFLIGAAKGGSTTFAFQLVTHPDIIFTSEKEPNIFNGKDVEECRKRLARVMQNLPDARYILDASVNYSQYPKFENIPAHIATICGAEDPRILYMMRNPVDRAVSQYFWRRERFGEDRPMREAITPDSQYMMSSRYDVQIEQYYAQFAKEQIRTVVHEDYYADVAGNFADICNWLGIDASHKPDLDLQRGATNKQVTQTARFPILNRIARSSDGLRSVIKAVLPQKQLRQLTKALSREVPREKLDPAFRAEMLGWFEDSIARTEELTGHDLSVWRSPPAH